jgi:hypothetical protein
MLPRPKARHCATGHNENAMHVPEIEKPSLHIDGHQFHCPKELAPDAT